MECEIVIKKTFKYIIKWLLLGLLMGAVCGSIGALFTKVISFVTNLRMNNSFMVFLLPVGAVATIFLYRLLNTEKISTDAVIESLLTGKGVSPRIIPAIFTATVISQAFGASSGKEGAALQLGGGFAGIFKKVFGLNENEGKILTACGMGALFAALFGTPVGTCVFALEVAVVGRLFLSAIFPTLVSSLSAVFVARLLGEYGERFSVYNIPSYTVINFLKVALIALAGMIVCGCFCYLLSFAEKYLPKIIKNPYFRILSGAVVLIALTLLTKSTDYNGTGAHIIHRIMNGGQVDSFAFLIKILFTVISVSCGFKGGEIVPTFCIGACLGFTLSSVLGVDGVFAAAVGMLSLFCCATKCPLATLIIGMEMFGYKGAVFYFIAVMVSFMPFVKGLYKSQIIDFSFRKYYHSNR
ncbi:MAG: chloride channel protein [Acutalibacteraceae bacterium]|nr:chloride channel protein [Acutalibacteraceae bacterium]